MYVYVCISSLILFKQKAPL